MNMKAQFSMQTQGERKAVMEAISRHIIKPISYTKAPRFAYETGGWSIDRAGVLTSPVFDTDGGQLNHICLMMRVVKKHFSDEALLSVVIFPYDFVPEQLGNINAILAGKATLIRHALGVDMEPQAALYDGIILADHNLAGGFVFPFFPATAPDLALLTILQFTERVYSQAASQQRVRTKDEPVENEKYAMRCFLLRIGMIGREYADARKELLSRLTGDGAFKSGARPPVPSEPDSLAEAMADAELIHSVNTSFAE